VSNSIKYSHIFFILRTRSVSGVMVSLLAASVVDHQIEPWSGQTKDYKIGICCFTSNTKH